MYQERLDSCQEQTARLQARCSRIRFFRLLSFSAAAIFFCLGYTKQQYGAYAAAAAAALAFLLLVACSSKQQKQLAYLTDYASVLLEYQARLTDGWKQLSVKGSRYLLPPYASPHSSDLDIFGNQSLYQYLCTASTVLGQDRKSVV